MIPPDVIRDALEVCEAASKGPAKWVACDPDPDNDYGRGLTAFLDRCGEQFDAAHEITGRVVVHEVEVVTPTPGAEAVCVAITGNGPTSAANARFFAAALHPEYGYAAALRRVAELERLDKPAKCWICNTWGIACFQRCALRKCPAGSGADARCGRSKLPERSRQKRST